MIGFLLVENLLSLKNLHIFSHPDLSSFIFHMLDLVLVVCWIGEPVIKVLFPRQKLEAGMKSILSMVNQTFLGSVTERLIFHPLIIPMAYFCLFLLYCSQSQTDQRVCLKKKKATLLGSWHRVMLAQGIKSCKQDGQSLSV